MLQVKVLMQRFQDILHYVQIFCKFLILSPRLTNFPKEVKEDLEDPHSRCFHASPKVWARRGDEAFGLKAPKKEKYVRKEESWGQC
ncbi:hypothetical protein PIB30_046203 [Stylosanthes scabra]|uniref:Uncharacterized protein n=1 Tax=Stylosanthes scabra TaxID=79078 RepID=A0ABU6ZF52_9FABA|nr:hypothetical protein [Stylosanthes scabra]